MHSPDCLTLGLAHMISLDKHDPGELQIFLWSYIFLSNTSPVALRRTPQSCCCSFILDLKSTGNRTEPNLYPWGANKRQICFWSRTAQAGSTSILSAVLQPSGRHAIDPSWDNRSCTSGISFVVVCYIALLKQCLMNTLS